MGDKVRVEHVGQDVGNTLRSNGLVLEQVEDEELDEHLPTECCRARSSEEEMLKVQAKRERLASPWSSRSNQEIQVEVQLLEDEDSEGVGKRIEQKIHEVHCASKLPDEMQLLDRHMDSD